MIVGVCRLRLLLPECQSLKDKRGVVRHLKDRARQKFNLAIAEVGDGDAWQSAVLGFAVVANDRRFVESVVEQVVGFIESLAKVVEDDKDFIQYGDEALSSDGLPHWEPEEDSPVPHVRRPRAPRAKQQGPFPWEEKGKPRGPSEGGD
jgi:uncharacterized protein YlxP (DUF503 family)